MGRLLALLLAIALAAGADETETLHPNPANKRVALDKAFHGRIVSIKKRCVTIAYDFEDPVQLEDFEEARPPRLLDAAGKPARIENGRLVLEGSTSIRHKMESAGGISATFKVRVTELKNVGAVVTEPVLSDFYVVYNLFDYRFNGNGAMHIAAVGLHEDEGAEDVSSGLVNFRDIFSGNLRKKVEVGHDVEVEVRKDGWKEFFRAGDVRGK
ncbi:MAG TPA: hypothetical protein VFY93_19225, partial [Planctomycetota bacterium]|nr:hypothetical protein [Planctomycetota bacterium]